MANDSSFSNASLLAAGGNKLAECDANGHLVSGFGTNGVATLGDISADALTVVTVANDGGTATSYTYDAAGNSTSQTDPNGNTTTFKYDQNGRLVREILPVGQVETWRYNAFGQVTTHIDFDGQRTIYTYDNSGAGEGRPVAKYLFAAGVSPVVALAAQGSIIGYNALGQRSEVDDYVGGVLSRQAFYSYDPITEQLASVTSPEGTIGYSYDSATGQLTSTTTNNTQTVDGYDMQGRLSTVTVMKLNGNVLGTALTTSYQYDAAGNKVWEVLSNGVTTVYTYDDLNRLTDVVETLGGNVLFGEHYVLNDNGSRASSVETQVQADGSSLTITTAWTYDALNRLTGESVVYSSTGTSNVSPPWYGLATSFVLPAADAYIGEANPGTTDILLMWNGQYYASAGGTLVYWNQALGAGHGLRRRMTRRCGSSRFRMAEMA